MRLRSFARFVPLISSVLLACEPTAASLRLEPLPAIPPGGGGPADTAVETNEGRLFAVPFQAPKVFALATGPDAGWTELNVPALRVFLPDFQKGQALGSPRGLSVHVSSGANLVPLEPPVPPIDHGGFSNVGLEAIRGRDVNGVLWAVASPTFGTGGNRVIVARFEPGAAAWAYDDIPLPSAQQVIPSTMAVLTRDARLFFRPYESGVWEIDRASGAVVERVTCDHELFLASHPDYRPCQQDVKLFAARDGALFILNAKWELWKLTPGTSAPTRVVTGELPELEKTNSDGTNRYSPGTPETYVDPRGRVWLAFRWGNNDSMEDVSYLYLANPGVRDGWTFLSKTLPRNIRLFGAGAMPLISNASVDEGFAISRLVE